MDSFINLIVDTIGKKMAYIDPGSGSVLLQLILAAILGAGVLIRTQWGKIKSIFQRKDQEADSDDPQKKQ